MGALLRLPGSTPGWGGQQASAEPLSIMRPKALSIQQRPPRKIGNIVGGAILRLIGAVLLEANDEWQLQHRYMQIEGMAELTPPIGIEGEMTPATPTQVTPQAA